jgi:uncharacterized delta-60 repeat protein
MRVVSRAFGVAWLVVLVGFAASAAHAGPGDLDPGFGSGGLVTTDFGGRGDFGLAVALQGDGKIVAAGNSSAVGVFSVSFALARYERDGSLDPTFGSGGTVLTSFGMPLSAAADVVVQPDGKIVAVGIAGLDFAVARYNADGALDSTFGTGGLVTTDFGGFDQANAVALQPDGKIVVAGPLQGAIGVARYEADGSLDSSFGTGGKVVTDASPLSESAFDVAVSNTAKIIVGGVVGLFPFGASDFELVRYNADGSLDASFGGDGVVTTDFAGFDSVDSMFALSVAQDGRITAAGSSQAGSSRDFAVARYHADGALDSSFGGDGMVTTDVSAGSEDLGNATVAHADGSFTVAGTTSSTPGESAFAVVRYTATGELDTGFGSGGKATAEFGNPINNAFDIAAQPDGKVVVAGGTAGGSASDFALARFEGADTAMTVEVDVKPESSDNLVPLGANGVVPVAILATASFDASTIEPASVCFGSADDPTRRDCTEKHGTGHFEDVNGDARPDLLLHYEAEQTGIAPADTRACLNGKTRSGISIEGCDTIRTR